LRTDTVAGFDILPSGARMDKLNGGGWETWVEFSVPKIGTGSNVIALPLRQAVDVGRQVYEDAGEVVRWMDSYEHLRVQCIDLDRDFEGVEHQEPLLAGLAKLRVAYNPKTRLFPDPANAGAVTLTRGPATRWQSTLYSKQGGAQHRLRYAPEHRREQLRRDLEAAQGRLRFEARLRADVLDGQRTVESLDSDELARLRRKYFDRVGYGMEVAGMDRAVALVVMSTLAEAAKLQTLGYLLAESQGMPVKFTSRTTVWKYRKLRGTRRHSNRHCLDGYNVSTARLRHRRRGLNPTPTGHCPGLDKFADNRHYVKPAFRGHGAGPALPPCAETASGR
jgi:hypothetical protein